MAGERIGRSRSSASGAFARLYFLTSKKALAGVLIVLKLEQLFAKAKLGFRRQAIDGYLSENRESLLGKRKVPAWKLPHARSRVPAGRRRRGGAGRGPHKGRTEPGFRGPAPGNRPEQGSQPAPCSRAAPVGRRLAANSSAEGDDHRGRLGGESDPAPECTGRNWGYPPDRMVLPAETSRAAVEAEPKQAPEVLRGGGHWGFPSARTRTNAAPGVPGWSAAGTQGGRSHARARCYRPEAALSAASSC